MVWVFFFWQSSAWRNPLPFVVFSGGFVLKLYRLSSAVLSIREDVKNKETLSLIGYGWLIHKCREKIKTLENELRYRPERWIGINIPPVALRGIRLLWQLKSPSSYKSSSSSQIFLQGCTVSCPKSAQNQPTACHSCRLGPSLRLTMSPTECCLREYSPRGAN